MGRRLGALLRGITGAGSLPVFLGMQGMTVGGQRLMRGVGVVLPDLVMPGRFAVKPRRLPMMRGGSRMMHRWFR
jgi:hypothetical protein